MVSEERVRRLQRSLQAAFAAQQRASRPADDRLEGGEWWQKWWHNGPPHYYRPFRWDDPWNEYIAQSLAVFVENVRAGVPNAVLAIELPPVEWHPLTLSPESRVQEAIDRYRSSLLQERDRLWGELLQRVAQELTIHLDSQAALEALEVTLTRWTYGTTQAIRGAPDERW